MAAASFGSSGALVLAGALLLLFSPLSDALSPGTNLTNTTGICRSIDIRNNVGRFKELKGCRVVEGFVQILLIDNVNESAFDNLSFPELREITDFLLLYRVNGLRSIGQLFPNLAVIRGQDKIFGYSFIVYEMSSLQEIGLHSLTNITSGLIRIDKNPSLCFVNSIDWERIAQDKGPHFIKNIKADNECPLCPGDDDPETKSPCPRSRNKSHGDSHLCWNSQHCQKICPDKCTACDSKGRCCDEKCLGGCSDDDPKDCHVCMDFRMAEKCMDSCPAGTYEFLGRRCITLSDCKNATKPFSSGQHQHPYKIFQNKTCLLNCPNGYIDDYVNNVCEGCNGQCTKECQGTVIDSKDAAKQLKGCTHINGSLEIQIRGGKNVVNALEDDLSLIEEIDGYLKIVRSFPLISLNFFKNLRLIRGNTLESQKYVFIVLDNQNLQDIWDWNNRTLQILNGRLFFHFNPRLCLDKIKELRDKAKLDNFTDLEVARNSNGDKIACKVHDLPVNIIRYHSKSVVLAWPQFQMKDHRKLLGYVVYSIKTTTKNITLYDGRDACGDDGWRVDDVTIVDDNNTMHYLLSNLVPYTQYAFYVKTYTIASESTGAQSRIYYFRTLADQPSLPMNIKIQAADSETFHITWDDPQHPNGNISYYLVSGQSRDEENEPMRFKNYCNAPTQLKETQPSIEIKPTVKETSNNTCDCKEDSKPSPTKKKNESDVSNQITFEDKLYNFVYIKKNKDSSRRKRNMEFPDSKDNNKEDLKNISKHKNETDAQGKYIQFAFRVDGKREKVVPNLKHYTNYEIKIAACRNNESQGDAKTCSEDALNTFRTALKVGADLVTRINITRTVEGKVIVTWDRPKYPNGQILAFDLKYQLLEKSHHTPPRQICVSLMYAVKNNNMTYEYPIRERLAPGNYSVEIATKSQAGTREWSKVEYFYIEEPGTSKTSIIFISLFIVIMAIGGVAYYIYKTKYAPPDDIKLIASVNPEYVVYEPDDWEVQRDKIKLIKELGQGSFGMVYEGIARDVKGKATTRCAIKTVNEHATNRERIEFLNEASVMKAFDTAHVVRLLGVVSQGQPTLVVMELMANGDLKSYLRSHRPDVDLYDKSNNKQPPTLRRILQMAIEIADGMAYLSAKKFVHRDLAARNCMVAEDLTVKIGDFGMTRDIYETDYYRKGTKGLLPVRWMAPESLKDGVFTSSSDVWSYGVVLWEMATLASQPYQGLSNDQVLRYVIDGGIMERPENCPDKLYDLMRCCWRHKPTDRPNFLSLCSLLLEDVSNTFCQISFYHSAAGMEARNSRPSQSPSQDDPSTPLRRNQIDENYSLTSSDGDSEAESEAESNIDFTSYPSMTKDVSSAVNGYVSTRPRNGPDA